MGAGAPAGPLLLAQRMLRKNNRTAKRPPRVQPESLVQSSSKSLSPAWDLPRVTDLRVGHQTSIVWWSRCLPAHGLAVVNRVDASRPLGQHPAFSEPSSEPSISTCAIPSRIWHLASRIFASRIFASRKAQPRSCGVRRRSQLPWPLDMHQSEPQQILSVHRRQFGPSDCGLCGAASKLRARPAPWQPCW